MSKLTLIYCVLMQAALEVLQVEMGLGGLTF